MNGLTINDMKPDARVTLLDAVAEERLSLDVATDRVLQEADTRVIIKGLYDRGVLFKDLFSTYYELEESSNGRQMVVQDARNAGYDGEVVPQL